MSRFSRRLKHNAGTEAPAHMVFVDTESCFLDPIEDGTVRPMRFMLGCATYLRMVSGKETRRDELDFNSIPAFWEWIDGLQSPKSLLWVFAHNIHHDLTQLCFWDLLERGVYTPGPVAPTPGDPRVRGKRPWTGAMCLRRSPYFMRLMGRNGRIVFCDTYNYFPTSLARIGEQTGVPKMPMPGPAAEETEWYAYCRNDVRVIETVVTETIRRWRADKCGVWATTSAGLAVHSFRHGAGRENGHGKAPDIIFTPSPAWDARERLCYLGGYSSVLYVGNVCALDLGSGGLPEAPDADTGTPERPPIVSVDARSLYPSRMAESVYPRKRLHYVANPSVARAASELSALGACAEVLIDDPDNEYPIRYGGRLVYALGKYVAHLCGAELKRAFDSGSVAAVNWIQYYSVADLFSEFVGYWWERRRRAEAEGDRIGSLLAKTVLNSLSGKFGQKPGRWVQAPKDHDMIGVLWGQWGRFHEGRVRNYRNVAGVTQRWDEPPSAEETLAALESGVREEDLELLSCGDLPFPAISAFITAEGREHMRRARMIAGFGRVLHQAVDSLHLTREGYERLIAAGLCRDGELGSFRLTGEYHTGEFFGTNWYTLNGNVTRTGIWGRAKLSADGHWYAERWDSCESDLDRNPGGLTRVASVDLGIDTPDGFGRVGSDGFVTPIVLPEPADARPGPMNGRAPGRIELPKVYRR